MQSAPATQAWRPVVYWYLSYRCNLRCRHCWVESSPYSNDTDELTVAEARSLIPEFCAIRAAGVVMTGGEPLAYPAFYEILQRLVDHRLDVSLETNGLLVDDRLIAAAIEARQHGVKVKIAVSLDGGDRESHEWLRGPGTFNRVVDRLTFLNSAGLQFRVQCVLNRRSRSALPGLLELAAQLQPCLELLILALPHPFGRAKQNWNELGLSPGELEEILKQLTELGPDIPKVLLKVPPACIPPRFLVRLFGPGSRFTCATTCAFPVIGILPNGEVTICSLTGRETPIRYGAIRSRALRTIFSESPLTEIRSRYLAGRLEGCCGSCTFAGSCRGGCRAYAFERFGDLFSPNPLCDALEREGRFPAAYRSHTPKGAEIGRK